MPRVSDDETTDAPASLFADLDAFQALPRAGGLALSPDGTRLVTSLQTLNPEANRFVTALWEVDPTGTRPARRLTRSAKGEQLGAFTPDGTLLFTSTRPDPEVPEDDDAARGALWALPPGGGEARVVASRPGGLTGLVVARRSGDVVLLTDALPGSGEDADSDAERRKARKDAKVTAVLHEQYPVRYWDHDLGPGGPRLLTGRLDGDAAGEPDLELVQVTGDTGHALHHGVLDITADGGAAVATWEVVEGRASARMTLVAIDLSTGARRTLLSDVDHEYEDPRISPDGTQVALQVYSRSTPQDPGGYVLAVVPLGLPGDGDGELEAHLVAPGWDRWSGRPTWTPDGTALLVHADSDGRAPLFRVEVATGEVTQLTGDDAAYSDICVSPDGEHVYAMRSAVASPPAAVRLDPRTPHQHPTMLRSPVPDPVVPGRVEEVTATAADGTPLRAWLCLPDGAGAEDPAPLLLWIHGGPLGSWNAWSWRWCPWLAVQAGYAVLLPDPALSTGYGKDFIRRGWGSWGDAPYTDLLAIIDVTVARDDVDGTRTAALGGSFGGYMANWVGGHTDRFRAIVTHASLYALDQFAATTDVAHYWSREMSPEMTEEHSPHGSTARWTTPTLVIHGDKDYRVPIGEALRLWWDLTSKDTDTHGNLPHKFLYFPDENHWILSPNHSTLWYRTVLAFLAHHVLGEEWRTPDLLR